MEISGEEKGESRKGERQKSAPRSPEGDEREAAISTIVAQVRSISR